MISQAGPLYWVSPELVGLASRQQMSSSERHRSACTCVPEIQRRLRTSHLSWCQLLSIRAPKFRRSLASVGSAWATQNAYRLYIWKAIKWWRHASCRYRRAQARQGLAGRRHLTKSCHCRFRPRKPRNSMKIAIISQVSGVFAVEAPQSGATFVPFELLKASEVVILCNFHCSPIRYKGRISSTSATARLRLWPMVRLLIQASRYL